jgi:hypothetical protein
VRAALRLVADGYGDPARSWDQGGVAADHAILGNHGVTVHVSQLDPMIAYLEQGIGAVRDGDGPALGARWRIGGGAAGRTGFVELVEIRQPARDTDLGEGPSTTVRGTCPMPTRSWRSENISRRSATTTGSGRETQVLRLGLQPHARRGAL